MTSLNGGSGTNRYLPVSTFVAGARISFQFVSSLIHIYTMRTSIRTFVGAALALLALSGCQKDFLDQDP